MAITKRLVKGTPLTAAEMDANITEIENASSSLNILSGSHESLSVDVTSLSSSLSSVSQSVSNLSDLQGTLSGQFTGSALISGSLNFTSQSLDYDNTSDKVLVFNPSTKVVGWNNVSGVGTSGTSGLDGTFFGTNGVDGTNGTAGSGGTSGVDGDTGSSGTAGSGGTSGTSGTNGTTGTAGSSGVDGTNGTAGSGGTSGTSAEGTSGTAGSGGTSGTSGINGFGGSNGTSGTSSTSANVTVKSGGTTVVSATNSLNFDSDTIQVTDTGGGEVLIEVIGGGGGGGTSGSSGTSGETSSSGTTGSAGTSGTSGTGNPGTNGTSGSGGTTGSSGSDGTDGTSGTGGSSGSNGTDGTGGTSGSSGLSTTLTVKDTGITEISEVRFLQISGSGVTLSTLGDYSASIFFPGADGAAFNSSSFEGWVTSSQQILEAGFLLSSSANFTGEATRTYGISLQGSTAYDLKGDVYGPNSTIGARIGDTLRFEVSASGHPFWIKTTPVTGAGSSVSGVTNNGDAEGIVIWDTSTESAGTFYYVSENSTTLSGEIILGPSNDGNKINGRGLAITGSVGLLGGQSITGSLVVKGYTNLTGSLIVNGRNISNDLFTLTGSQNSLPYYPNFYSAVSDIQISGSLSVSSSLTASLSEGYVWVGGSGSVATLLSTSSLGGGAGGSGIFSITGSSYHTINDVSITGSLEVRNGVTASGFNVFTGTIPKISSPTNLNLEALGGSVNVVTSSFRLASYTDSQTGSLVVSNGDMIYNSTTNKFMGYANGDWVALH